MPNKDIAIVIPSLNEGDEIRRTVSSLLSSAERRDAVEVVVVDDASDKPVGEIKDALVIRNPCRYGPATSRDIGICHTTAPFILTVDAHVGFPEAGWLDFLLDELESHPDSVFCFSCIDLKNGKKMYGGTLDALKVAENIKAFKILEPRWNSTVDRSVTSSEVLCPMGGAYAFRKDWHRKIRSYRGIKGWCTSELVSLGLKSWLAGGDCRIIPSLEFKHLFRSKAPWGEERQAIRLRNKMWLSSGLVYPSPYSGLMSMCLGWDKEAIELVAGDLNEIVREREYNQAIAKRSFEEVCGRFGVELPTIQKADRNGMEGTRG